MVVLNSYIAIFSITTYQNVSYNGGAKSIFLVPHSTQLFLVMHRSWKVFYFIFLFFYKFVCSNCFWLFYSFFLHVSLLTLSPSASLFLQAYLHEPSCHQPTLQSAITADPCSVVNHTHRINPLHSSTPHRPNSPASHHRINPMIRWVIHTTSPPL